MVDQPSHLETGPNQPSADRRVIYVARGRPAHHDRGPLPAGHALSWGAINAGTVLDGADYPFPIFN